MVPRVLIGSLLLAATASHDECFAGRAAAATTCLASSARTPQSGEPKADPELQVEYVKADREFSHDGARVLLTALRDEAQAASTFEQVIEEWGRGFVATLVPKVVLAGEVQFEDRSVRSHLIGNSLLVACDSRSDDERLADWRLRMGLRRAIARAFLTTHGARVDTREWDRLNPAEFKYAPLAMREEVDGEAVRPESRLKDGFLFEECRSSRWNDITYVVAAITSDDERIASAVGDHKRLRAKFGIALDLLRAAGWTVETAVSKATNTASISLVASGGPWRAGGKGEFAAAGTAALIHLSEDDPCAVCDALKRYPRGTIDKLIRVVYTARDISVNGTPMPSTFGSDFVVIAAPTTWDAAATREFTRSFHHELSSIVFATHMGPRDREAWEECNDPAFRYTGEPDGVDPRTDGDSELLIEPPSAILTPFSKTSLENDFNMLAEWLFTDPARVFAAAERHDRLAWKLKILIGAYGRVDKKFTEEWFRKLPAK